MRVDSSRSCLTQRRGAGLNENRHMSERGVEVLFAVLPFSRHRPARDEALLAELAASLRL